MGVPREPTYSMLVVACFSRHVHALDWAANELAEVYGELSLLSPDFSFHHTKYYEPTMGQGLVKRFVVFSNLVRPDCLPTVKRFTMELENRFKSTHEYPETRPLNLDPGLIQLGKFLLASTKDQAHRVYLQDDIFAEVTLRFESGAFEVWPWTYADYREPAVREFLAQARQQLYERVTEIRSSRKVAKAQSSES